MTEPEFSNADAELVAAAICKALLGGSPPNRKKMEPPADLIARIQRIGEAARKRGQVLTAAKLADAINRHGYVQIKVEFDEESQVNMARLAQASGAKTLTDVLLNALGFYEWALTEHIYGRSVGSFIEGEEGASVVELFPNL